MVSDSGRPGGCRQTAYRSLTFRIARIIAPDTDIGGGFLGSKAGGYTRCHFTGFDWPHLGDPVEIGNPELGTAWPILVTISQRFF